MMMLSAAGCYYGSGMGYGSYANANKIKTTAAADTLEEFKITDFQASDGTFQYKDLGWLSSYQDLEKEIGMPIGTTTAFTEGETMGDINYSVKLLNYISVGMQPVFDPDGGLTTLTVYFEDTYTAEQLDELFDKAVAAAREAFGDEDKYQENDQDGGKGTVYHTTGAFWYNETDQYGDYTMNSFQIGKPFGFLLLTIHWFNPLMWMAYVLLCRDIELACDEKVIKELGNEQRGDYTQALVACSVNRRMIAACPLTFGEVGVKERVKSVMNYKKPALWVIIIAVIVCVGVAVCFLTNPKQDSYTLRIVVPAGSQEEFVYTDKEVSAIRNSIKIWSGDGLGDTEVLLSPVNKTTETGYTATYLTHGMPVEFDAEKDTWFKIGVNMQNPTNEDIIVYVEVENVEVRIVDEINSVIKWFDYTENPSAMDDESTINLPIYPDVTFSYNQAQIIASKPFDTSELTDHTILITGMPIWNAYFADLTGDDYPEICATYTFGSGIIDSRIIIYDYAKGSSYELSDRGYFDFTLRLNEADGYLYVDKTKYNTDELVETGRLVFKNNCIQIEGFSNEAHQDSCKDPGTNGQSI